MSWKTGLGIANIASLVLLVWMMAGRNSGPGSAKDAGAGRIEFPPDKLAFWAWLLVVVPPVWTTIRNFTHGANITLGWISSGCIGFLALAHMVSFPETVVVTDDGVEQVYWMWKNRHIAWGDIVEISIDKGSRMVTIKGADGTVIVHSGRLVDRPRLLAELKQRCGENLPPEFPGEPGGEDAGSGAIEQL